MKPLLSPSHDGVSRAEKWLVASLLALLVYSAWFRGGTPPACQPPLTLLGLAAAIAAARTAGRPFSRLALQPFFWLGAVFLILLWVQWWNAGRYLFFNPLDERWEFTLPRLPKLPSAVSRAEAAEMLHWFFPAWILAVSLRAGLLGGRAHGMLLGGLAAHAALLAAFGIAQHLSGTRAIYWRLPVDYYFFASFGYPNHAGAYFLLTFGLCAGLMARELSAGCPPRPWRRAALAFALLLTLTAAQLSFSRAAILLSTLLAGGGALYGAGYYWKRLSPAARVNLVAALAAGLCLGAFAVASLGRKMIAEELTPWRVAGSLTGSPRHERLVTAQAALGMWKDHPWFGVGGWGYGNLLTLYLPRQDWALLTLGKANLHNDPLQFLAEFGVIGSGLMVAMAALILWPIFRYTRWQTPALLLPLAGAGFVVLQSLIDLPFRCPAVLYAWLALLLALPGWSRSFARAGEAGNRRPEFQD